MTSVTAIVHNCGILSYPFEHWNNLKDSDWEALEADWQPCLGSLEDLRKAWFYLGCTEHYTFMEGHRMAARDKLDWLMARHEDDYFTVVPRDIISVVLLFLRMKNRIRWECEEPRTALLGLMHSWDDQPSHKYVNTNKTVVMEWHWCGLMHREGGQPAHLNVNVHSEEYYFNWFLRGKHGRTDSAILHMRCVRGEYSYGFPEDLVVTTDPAIVAEIDALVACYAS